MDIPLRLLDVRPPVKEIHVRGQWDDDLFRRAAAVVGSRKMTGYGQRVVEILVAELVANKYTIVSGMMYGVDQEAHKQALSYGGKTVAVLGWGIDWGREEKKLENEIAARGGLVISEYEGEMPGRLWTFPHRNRLIAALSEEVYVVEAALKSGSLNTAAWARRYGRKVYAVPGPVTSSGSEGTNWLIAEGMARPWQPKTRPSRAKDGRIYRLLKGGQELTINEIARSLGRTAGEVAVELTMLAIKGEISEKEGKYYL